MLRFIETIRTACSPSLGTDLEMRLYRILSLAAALLSLFVVVPSNLLQNISPYVNLAVVAFGIASTILYRLSMHGSIYPKTFFLSAVVTLNVTWFLNGGSQGSVGFYFFAAGTYPLIFFRGRERWTLLVLFVLNGVTLLVADFRYPELVIPFNSPSDRLIDLVTGFVTSAVACGLMLWGVLSSHDREHERQNELNRRLAEVLELNRKRTLQLENSLSEIRTLQGLLPICSWCKKIRDDHGLWTRIEEYISTHTDAEFTHSLCPDCFHDQCEKEARQGSGRLPVARQVELFPAAVPEDGTP